MKSILPLPTEYGQLKWDVVILSLHVYVFCCSVLIMFLIHCFVAFSNVLLVWHSYAAVLPYIFFISFSLWGEVEFGLQVLFTLLDLYFKVFLFFLLWNFPVWRRDHQIIKLFTEIQNRFRAFSVCHTIFLALYDHDAGYLNNHCADAIIIPKYISFGNQ